MTDPRVLEAVSQVPRASFVAPEDVGRSDLDRPLSIGLGQTTSQPSLIAVMVEALELTGDERVLEVGTGFGYQTALLSHLAAEVVSVERHAALAEQASENLRRFGCDNVEVVVSDGTRGWAARAPYDAILVAAATAEVPEALAAQLREGGRLVAPIGHAGGQQVHVYLSEEGRLRLHRQMTAVRFVPLISDD